MVITTPTGYPAWSRRAAIGDYGGSLDKEDSVTEAEEPYAAQWYRELHAMRGSGFTQSPYTLVDAENIAIARMSAAVWSRMPEKVRANATPLRADEKLENWVLVLNVPTQADDQRWQIRERCVASYKSSQGPTAQGIVDSLSDLLGETFVDATWQTGADLATPPTITYWPGVNAGPATYSLGGGAWFSERSHLTVQVTPPASSGLSEFYNLMNVQMFQLLDTLLPCWATFNWADSDGFLLDISQLDFAGL